MPVPEPAAAPTLLKRLFGIDPAESRVVLLSFGYFFLLMASYFVLRPLRDTMGTVYGVDHLQELFTGTFLLSFIVAPVYAGLASRIRLATFLPWVYGFIAITMVIFYILFQRVTNDRWVAAAFYIWLSTFNLLIISVFWSLMADIFSSTQAKRLFGVIAAGGTLGTVAAPAFIALFVTVIGTDNLLLTSAGGFALCAVIVRVLEAEKRRLVVSDVAVQKTSLDHSLGGNPLDGFVLLFRSRYLLLIALFLLLMTCISTVLYFQLGDLISKNFADREARTQAYATIDLATNSVALLIQLFGTGRFLQRFGVTAGLLVNPVIMVLAFVAVVFSPGLLVLGAIQVVRRFSEYSVAKPSRDMLFTIVDQQEKYKAKNVIDTVVYRFGDVVSAWVSAAILPFGVTGLALLGVVIALFWFPIAFILGRRYESGKPVDPQARPDESGLTGAAPATAR
ncbi:hypothetical protein LWE61_11725 [Sphingobium sufflavum]|uniref:NTP/NDP exchange transporter n=1 Tax=Sphingobium sufflavum TaxID=1129547 RepID=UPI001F3D4208|nr:Npt1/Npt2 family nucleotide transporter [Sphingobium sufflavum]MCE7797226.1 hypothetical protein [Sphingobium sufflavum]